MPVLNTDLTFRLSGGAANTNPLTSLGGAKSSQVISFPSSTLFDTVTGAESAAGLTEYRCIYFHNASAQTAFGVVVWIPTNTAGNRINIGLGTSALNAQEQGPLATEATAPSGVTFVAAATQGAGISLGDVPAGQHRAIWIRRTVGAGTAAVNDSFTLRANCDTEA